MHLFELWFSPSICPGVGFLGHMVVLFLAFWGTSIIFSIMALPIYISTNSVGGLSFLYILSTIYCFVHFFDDGHSGSADKETSCQCKIHRFSPWVRKFTCRRKWQPAPVFFPGKFQVQRSLVGYSPWGHKESEWLSMHTHAQAHILTNDYLILILIFTSLIMSYIEDLFMCLLTIYTSFWRDVYLGFSHNFWLDYLFFYIKLHELFVYFGD